SPVFTEMQKRRTDSSAPLGQLFRYHKRPVILAALIFAANNAAGYLVIAFFASYGANVLNVSRSATLVASIVGGVGWFVFTLFGGWIGVKIGKCNKFIIRYLRVIAW